MCGLVGAAGNCQTTVKDTFTELLLVDVVRGAHSTGAAIVERGSNKISLAKAAIPSPYFIGMPEYKQLTSTMGLKAMIGHNRYATVGEKNSENAHPFEFDNVVGAHNGTLDSWALKNLEDWATFGTDSAALYNSISKYGVKEAIGQVSGAWALTWYDKANNTMNMLRNAQRPLFYAYSADRETLFWASEATMLEWVVKRNKIKLFEDGVFEVETNRHYKWEMPNSPTAKFEKPTLAVVEGRTYTFQGYTRTSKHADYAFDGDDSIYAGYNYTGSYTPMGSGGTAKVVPLHPNRHKHSAKGVAHKHDAKNKVDTKKFRPPYKDAYGHIINKVQFEALVKNSCVFCDETNSSWGDFILPLKDDVDGRKLYLCAGCYEEDEIRELISQAI